VYKTTTLNMYNIKYSQGRVGSLIRWWRQQVRPQYHWCHIQEGLYKWTLIVIVKYVLYHKMFHGALLHGMGTSLSSW